MALKNQVQLIVYPNRMGTGLRDLGTMLEKHVLDAVGGVHILPIYPSNADGGFSPLTHKEVDPDYGTWEDVEAIAKRFDLCLDLTLNHISDESPEFIDFLNKGKSSEYADLFVDVDDFEPMSQENLAKIHIRKEKLPFREITFGDGTKGRVWCTFTERQVDLNYDSPKTYDLLFDYMRFMMARGVKLFRLDAFGYVTKRLGTNCFIVEPEIWDILERFRQVAADDGAEIMPEVHDHFSHQLTMANRGMYAYGFALPVLVLHAFLRQDTTYLKNWLRICPHRQVTVLDTHDGICIPDAEHLIPPDEIKALIDDVSQRSEDPILRRSAAHVGSVGAIYQLTCTYFDALKRDEKAYLAARAIQFFTPGIPQVYYMGLLGATNDHDEVQKTGELRDINRSFFTLEEVDEHMRAPMVQKLVQLMKFRSQYPAFQGRFDLHYSDKNGLHLSWSQGELRADLEVNCETREFAIHYVDENTKERATLQFDA